MSKKTARRKRCLACHNLFESDPRAKDKQKYCSEPTCQTIRQRKNEKAWRRRNPECLEQQYLQTKEWFKARPAYSSERRRNNPQLAEANQKKTRLRMKNLRQIRLFDKSKVILTQLSGNKEVKYYLTKGKQWLYLRLTKASLLSKLSILRHNGDKIINNLPKTSQLYELAVKGH